jgi:hypothetical protein
MGVRDSAVRLAPCRATSGHPDVGYRALDDIACRINNEAQATPAMKEGQAKIPSVSINATFTQARDGSPAHQRLNKRRPNREACGDDCRIDTDRALLEFHSAHSLHATVRAPRESWCERDSSARTKRPAAPLCCRSFVVGFLCCRVSGHATLYCLLIFDLDPIAGTKLFGPFCRWLKRIEERQGFNSRPPWSILQKSSHPPWQKEVHGGGG